jgi:CheY-like chemotaxis protein
MRRSNATLFSSGEPELPAKKEKIEPPTFFILLTDDSAVNRLKLKALASKYFKDSTLSLHQIQFVQAIHGGEALNHVNAKIKNDHMNFNLIFMDIHMRTAVDGLETTKNIRALEEEYIKNNELLDCKRAYIIRYSSEALPSPEALAEQGFDAMLNKEGGTTQAQMNETLTKALERYPEIQYHDPLNHNDSPKMQK